jgi:hypothetical protein
VIATFQSFVCKIKSFETLQMRQAASNKTPSVGRGPIAKKVIAAARASLERRLTNLADWREARLRAEDDRKTVISRDNLSQYDPLHALYIYGQNQLSVLIEQLARLPMLDKLAGAYAAAFDAYMPSGPPISPLTGSYFTCWAAFDLSTSGAKKETLCTVATDFCQAQKVDEGLITLFETMQASRMGVYRHEGTSGRFVFLRELVTDQEIKAISPSGYLGKPGEVWLVRVLPPPFADLDLNYSVVFTTPYLLGKLGPAGRFRTDVEEDWSAYFKRNLAPGDQAAAGSAYELLMKYGLSRKYWNEYIFLAYRDFRHDVVMLEGIPDIVDSLPHADVGRARLRL